MSASPVDAASGAGFGDDDFFELREEGFEAIPNPEGDVFTGRVFEAGNLVEIMVVEFFPERFEHVGDVGVIHDPAELWVARAFHHDFSAEAVAVQAAAFVRFGQVRQEVRCFELESFSEFEIHRIERHGVPPLGGGIREEVSRSKFERNLVFERVAA
jgi:hypothetical protein